MVNYVNASELKDLLENDESLSVEELKQCDNITPFRNWIIKVIE